MILKRLTNSFLLKEQQKLQPYRKICIIYIHCFTYNFIFQKKKSHFSSDPWARQLVQLEHHFYLLYCLYFLYVAYSNVLIFLAFLTQGQIKQNRYKLKSVRTCEVDKVNNIDSIIP